MGIHEFPGPPMAEVPAEFGRSVTRGSPTLGSDFWANQPVGSICHWANLPCPGRVSIAGIARARYNISVGVSRPHAARRDPANGHGASCGLPTSPKLVGSLQLLAHEFNSPFQIADRPTPVRLATEYLFQPGEHRINAFFSHILPHQGKALVNFRCMERPPFPNDLKGQIIRGRLGGSSAQFPPKAV